MVRHMLLIAVVPPMLLLGLSPLLAATIHRLPGVALITEPTPAMLVYAASVILWHIPPI